VVQSNVLCESANDELEERTMKTPKTVIVTGASQGIGACLVKTFLERGYQVVATAQHGGIRLSSLEAACAG
jgi:NAD(P)-dependent dehydrogenase (short-subunit alcohol dehydrogenase family)